MSASDSHLADCECFTCKIKTIQVSPSATPNRRKHNQPVKKSGNSWEKGTVRDNRNMTQLLPGTLEPMPIKTYVEKRHEIEEGKRKMAQAKPQEE